MGVLVVTPPAYIDRVTSFRAAPPSRSGARRLPSASRAAALAELDRIWQRGPAGQMLLLVSATSALLTTLLALAFGLSSILGS
ncbi:hypothetical protein BH10ACT1_BH10ACT1_07700 [soil metagenome]